MNYYGRSILWVFLIIIIGAAVGVVFGDLVALLLPEGVVKQFFLQNVSWGMSPVTMDLLVVTLTFGLRFKFSVSSLLGLGVAYYYLRYFR